MERSIDTPLMRCSDSARLVSGNLPMSAATMPSTIPSALRFRFIEEPRLARRPVTTTVVTSPVLDGAGATPAWSDSCACAGAMSAAQAVATARLIKVCFAFG